MVIELTFLISCLTLLVTLSTSVRLSELEERLRIAKIQNDVTQKIPVRKRRKF